MMSRCWLFRRPEAHDRAMSTSVCGRLSMMENRPLPICAAERDRGPVVDRVVELGDRDQARDPGADTLP